MIEIINKSGTGMVVVQPTPYGAACFYYTLGAGGAWLLNRQTEMKTASFEDAVELATTIVNGPPRMGRR